MLYVQPGRSPLRRLVFTVIATLAVFSCSRAVGQVYVSPCGSDSNFGTVPTCNVNSIFSPMRTIAAAINRSFILGGVDVIIAPGTYAENLTINAAFSTTIRALDPINAPRLVPASPGTVLTINAAAGQTITLRQLRIENGTGSSPGGGGVRLNSGNLVVDRCTFSGNTAVGNPSSGGAILAQGSGSVSISGSVVSANSSQDAAGGVAVLGSNTLTVEGSLFSLNTAVSSSAHLEALPSGPSRPPVILRDTIFNSGTSGGAAISVVGSDIQVTRCTFTGNDSSLGALANIPSSDSSSAWFIEESTFAGNSSSSSQFSALYVIGFSAKPLLVRNSTFRNNTSTSVAIDGTTVIDRCRFSADDSATDLIRFGVFQSALRLSVSNSIFRGGRNAFFGVGRGNNTFSNCTFLGQSVQAIDPAPEGTTTITNSILWNQAGPPLPMVNFSHSLLQFPPSPTFNGPGNLIGIDPSLDSEGRPTRSSPAIDRASFFLALPDTADSDNDTNLTEPTPFDIDGNARFRDTPGRVNTAPELFSPADLGAFEFQGVACETDLNSDGFTDDADFVTFASQYERFTVPAGSPGDFNFDGFVDDADFVGFAQAYEDFLCP